MKPEDELKQILKLLSELREESVTSPIIVEGKKDERALRTLGFGGTILQLNRGLSVVNFCDELKARYEKVIILCDWDRTGGKLASKLSSCLANLGMEYDIELRREIIFLAKKRIKDVEGILSYVSDLLRELQISCEFDELITKFEEGKILS